VKVFGRSTASIADGAEWLAIVDRFGIVSERAVLLDALSVMQNLAMPFTLDIEPPADDIRARAGALAREVELPESTWARPLAELDRPGRVRVRLARALALGPAIVLLEHIAADLASPDAILLGRLVREVARRRRAAVVAATADEAFARAAADRVLMLEAATGRLTERRRWFRRG
jgi:ABC-type lipoprotein export system ATPase subunit